MVYNLIKKIKLINTYLGSNKKPTKRKLILEILNLLEEACT